jgi:MFS family permease
MVTVGSHHSHTCLLLWRTRTCSLTNRLYLAFYVAVAAYIPFVPLYFKQNNLPASRIGILTSLNPIMSIFGGPIAGLAADRTGRPRLILMLLVIVSSLFRLSLAAIVEISDDANDVFGVIFVAVLFGEFCGAPINALIDAGTVI